MSAAACAMASGLTSSARRFVVQLEITNKTKPSEQLASLGPQSSRLFFKNKLTRDGVLAPSATVFRPFTWSAGTFKLGSSATSSGRSAFKHTTGRRQPAVDVYGQLLFA